jgi:membrane fusion protein (multidrug efflux system)
MNFRYYSAWIWIGVIAAFAGCKPSDGEMQKKPVPATTVKLVQAKRGAISRSISLPATVVANQQAALYAKVSGYLKTIKVDKGDAVTEGELLAEIEAPELVADQAKYKADLDVAELDFKRISEAQQKAPDLVVTQTVDAAKAKYLVAKAALERAETLLGFCKIVAPFSGVVTARNVDRGAFIPAATSANTGQASPLLTVMDFSTVRVQVSVPESEVPLIRKELPVKIAVDALAGQSLNGKVTRFAQALDESKTMLVEIDLPNPKAQLLPGMYAMAKLAMDTKPNALLLPIEAVAMEKAGNSVFTIEQDKAKKIPVKIGFNDGINVEITDGVQEGQAVILIGKQTLASGQPVQVSEAK